MPIREIEGFKRLQDSNEDVAHLARRFKSNIIQAEYQSMQTSSELSYYKHEFWRTENLKYLQPHFRLEKSARIINELAQGRECELLDVGCGPATLKSLLGDNIRYHGVDIAIHDSAPNLLQRDFLEEPIAFGEKRFDIVVAQGVFEYAGNFQSAKFAEIRGILKDNGLFVLSYVNFNHLNIHHYERYNNEQKFGAFKKSIEQFFNIDRIIPTSHNWHHAEPTTRLLKALHMAIRRNIPVISRLFAVEYFILCKEKKA